jgi:hypothetical protein
VAGGTRLHPPHYRTTIIAANPFIVARGHAAGTSRLDPSHYITITRTTIKSFSSNQIGVG